MRHKYETRGIVLSRAPLGEMSASVSLLTPDLGLVRARAQSVRRTGAKLAPALATYAESALVLVRGNEGWRVSGAVLEKNHFSRMGAPAARVAARVAGLLLRLVAGETHDLRAFAVVEGFFTALPALPENAREAAEALAALRILAALGLDAGEIPGEPGDFSPETLARIMEDRTGFVARVNRGIAASGL